MSSPPRTTCLTDDTLAVLLDGTLDPASLTRIAAHIDDCPTCRHVVAEVGRGVDLSRNGSGSRAAPLADAREWAVLPNGTAVGRYVIGCSIGAGAMGVVYMARDPELDRNVALKLLRDDAGTEASSGGSARMLREAKAMARLSHPNVIAIYDVGAVDHQVFLAMELVEGGTLGDWLRQRPRSWREVVEVFRAAGEGLAAAHAAGLVHRDFKPDNVLVSTDGRVRVTDFGLARAAERPPSPGEPGAPPPGRLAHSLTRSSTFAGTPAYMAPEQLARRPTDARSDVFGFCVALYEALYGERPFDGIERGKVRPAPPRSRVPAWLRRIVLHGLEEKRESRPASMRALLDDIDRGRSRSRSRVALYALAPVAVGAIAVALAARARPASRAPVSAAPPRPTVLTDLPLPASTSAEALRVYEGALHGLRDGQGSVWRDFVRAAELDPTLSAAHLRGALTDFQLHPSPSRERLAKAAAGRHRLSDRDGLLLAAAQAWMQREPPDEAGYARAMDAAVSRYPLDAELAFWASNAHHVAGDSEATLTLADQALRVDPAFTAASCLKIEELVFADEGEKAADAIRECAASSPEPVGCLLWQNNLDMVDGNSARLAETSRQLLTRDPAHYPLYWHLAGAAYAEGHPTEAVNALLQQYVALAPPEHQAGFRALTASATDVLSGKFAVVEDRAQDSERRIEAVADARWHVPVAEWRVSLAEETARAGDAGEIAERFFRHEEAWLTQLAADDLALSRDPTPGLLLAERRAGLLSPPDFERKRDEWAAKWVARMPRILRPLIWVHGYAAVAENADDAARALAEQPNYGKVPHYTTYVFADAYLGMLYELAGRTADALPFLERATRSARAIEFPFVHTRAHLALGQALALEGKRDEACAAYGVVLSRWGHATPRSVTAEEARSRARELRCSFPP